MTAVNALHAATLLLILIWQALRIRRATERIRNIRRRRLFYRQHEENMKAARCGEAVPHPGIYE